MKRVVGLLTGLMFACILLSVSSASAGVPYCWFNKWVMIDDVWVNSPVATLMVPMETDVHWLMRITIAVPTTWGGPIEDIVVMDRFGAEIEMEDPFPISITHGTASYITKGGSDKVVLKWEIDELLPGDYAELVFEISTDLNPAGHQEYTTPCYCGCPCYELNSGAVLKFMFEGHQHSAEAETIDVFVY